MEKKIQIAVSVSVQAPIENVWTYWTEPEHIKGWNHASIDWHTTTAENELRENGHFSYRMEAKDGSAGFDFSGVYKIIRPFKEIDYELDDLRKVRITFESIEDEVVIKETFEAESSLFTEMQKAGWQSILDQFKIYAEKIQAGNK